MKATVMAIAAILLASAAAADEYVYVYVKAPDAGGEAVRHRLECIDAKCEVEVQGESRALELTDEQRDSLRAAVVAETKAFNLDEDVASDAGTAKIKFKYQTPRLRVGIERHIAADDTQAVTPEMGAVLATLLQFDLVPAGTESTTGQPSEPRAE
jgi:hypothetical protein